MKTIELVYMALFIVLITICSWICIPVQIPFSLQTFAVFLTILLLGRKRAVLSIITYILLGIVGIPVFTGFQSGFAAIFGATGGYIIGFIFCALIAGFILDKFGKKMPVMIFALLSGLFVCYLFGSVWFMLFYTQNTGNASFLYTLSVCVIPYIIPDFIKIAGAIILYKRLHKYINI